MVDTLFFQIPQALVALVFVVFISDFRKKRDMVPLVKEKWTSALRLSYLVPVAIYSYVIVTLQWVSLLDLLALGLTLLGMLLVSKAKRDLSRHHTWAGYCLKSSKLFTNGIYAYIRHPLYTGVYVFIFGMLLAVLPHTNYWLMTLAAPVPLIYVMISLAHSAPQETEVLAKKLALNFSPTNVRFTSACPCADMRNQQTESTVEPIFPLKPPAKIRRLFSPPHYRAQLAVLRK